MGKHDKSDLILNGNITKALITLSVPIMINSLIQTLFNLVDGIWVSKLSSVHFAATSFVWPINFLFISLGIGVSIAGTSLLSRLVGAGKIKEAKEYTNQIMAVSLLMSLLFTVVGVLVSPIIIKAMGATGDMASFGNTYLRITFLDMPFLFLFFNINSIMNSQGNTVTPTILSGGAAILNIVLDPIFIFTLNMGIAGAAWATLISRALLAVVGIYMIYNSDNKLKPSFKKFKFNKEILKRVFKVGFPASVGQAGAAIGFIVLNGFVVSYGTATVAAFGMVNRVTSLIMQPAMGLGTALTAIIGQNIGAGQMDRVIASFHKAAKLTTIFGVVGCGFLLLFDQQIVNFFIQSRDDPKVIIEGIEYLRYISFSQPLMGLFSVFQGVFQGTGKTKYSMIMEIGRLWLVRIPMILVFKNYTNMGSTGIWFSMSFSNLIVCVYGFWVYRRGKWKNTEVESIDDGQLTMDN